MCTSYTARYICILSLQYIWISSGPSRCLVLTSGLTSEYPTCSVCACAHTHTQHIHIKPLSKMRRHFLDNVKLAQLVRARDCQSRGCRFDSGRISKTENSKLQGFKVHRPSSKGTKSLFQVVKAIINQSLAQTNPSHWNQTPTVDQLENPHSPLFYIRMRWCIKHL